MISVALRTRVEARLLPAAGPAPQPRQHRGCSPVLGLKHSVEWALPPPAAGTDSFCLQRTAVMLPAIEHSSDGIACR